MAHNKHMLSNLGQAALHSNLTDFLPPFLDLACTAPAMEIFLLGKSCKSPMACPDAADSREMKPAAAIAACTPELPPQPAFAAASPPAAVFLAASRSVCTFSLSACRRS